MIQKKFDKARKFLKKAGVLIVLQVALLPSFSLAADVDNSDVSVKVPTDLKLTTIMGKIRDYIFGIVIIACVFMVLWGAFNLATSGGDESKVTDAKKKITYAAVGLVVASLAMAIVGLLMNIIGA